MGGGRACFLPSDGKISKIRDSAGPARLWMGGSSGKCGLLTAAWVGGKWKLQLHSWACLSPDFLNPPPAGKTFLPVQWEKQWSSTGAMVKHRSNGWVVSPGALLDLKLCYCCIFCIKPHCCTSVVLCGVGGQRGEHTRIGKPNLRSPSSSQIKLEGGRRVGQVWVIAGWGEF